MASGWLLVGFGYQKKEVWLALVFWRWLSAGFLVGFWLAFWLVSGWLLAGFLFFPCFFFSSPCRNAAAGHFASISRGRYVAAGRTSARSLLGRTPSKERVGAPTWYFEGLAGAAVAGPVQHADQGRAATSCYATM